MPVKTKGYFDKAARPTEFRLAWKSMDIFPEEGDDEKFFFEGKTNLGNKKPLLREMFSLMHDKWQDHPRLKPGREKVEKKKHVWVSGGNVTYYSSLAELFRKLQIQRPGLPIRALLVEGDFNEIIRNRIDMGFYAESSESEEEGLTKDFQPESLRREADDYHKEYFEDTAYFYCGKELIKEYGSIEKVMEKAPVIFGRPATPFEVGVKEEFYEVFPGKTRAPTIIADQTILNNFLMLNSVAIWFMFDSWKGDRCSSLVKMEKLFTFKRIFVRRNKFSRVKMGRRIMR